MDESYLQVLTERLGVWGVTFEPGLTNAEVSQVETIFGFQFPPDLRCFIQFALPVSRGWPNWRRESDETLRQWLNDPADGICFDIEHNGFWMDAWGPRPADLFDARNIARNQIAAAPLLIPVCGHRFMPEEPSVAGNPVFSIHQTDIIHYGFDLASYFANEFSYTGVSPSPYQVPCPDWAAKSPRFIRFWDDLISWNNAGLPLAVVSEVPY